jgi:hypothetical protein
MTNSTRSSCSVDVVIEGDAPPRMTVVRLSGNHNNLSIPSDQIITEINSSNRNSNANVGFETDERNGSDLPNRWAIRLARRQQAARRAAYRKQNCEIYSETK